MQVVFQAHLFKGTSCCYLFPFFLLVAAQWFLYDPCINVFINLRLQDFNIVFLGHVTNYDVLHVTSEWSHLITINGVPVVIIYFCEIIYLILAN